MTNKEKYKQAFSTLHASDEISLEVRKMDKKNRKFYIRPAVAACIVGVFLFGSMATAYAADLGGIHEMVQSWFDGEAKQMEVTPNEDNGYTFTYQEGDQPVSINAKGIGYDEAGNEFAMSAEDIADNLSCDVTTYEDGSVWLCYYSYKVDITDKLVDGACQVTIDDNGENVDFDIQMDENGGYKMKITKGDQVMNREFRDETPKE